MTGKIRDQGSNFSHETRGARLLATLPAKQVLSIFSTLILGESTYKRLVFLVGSVSPPI